jgi:hypothetical protein
MNMPSINDRLGAAAIYPPHGKSSSLESISTVLWVRALQNTKLPSLTIRARGVRRAIKFVTARKRQSPSVFCEDAKATAFD